MAASRNRAFVHVQPLGTSRRLALVLPHTRLPAGAERLAELDNGARGGDEYGWLVRMPTGTLAIAGVNGVVRLVDQRKAQAALGALKHRATPRQLEVEGADDIEPPPADPTAEAAELAALVKRWRGDMPASRAAQLLGMSARTLEGIEQGRGFRYPRLLILALAAFR